MIRRNELKLINATHRRLEGVERALEILDADKTMKPYILIARPADGEDGFDEMPAAVELGRDAARELLERQLKSAREALRAFGVEP